MTRRALLVCNFSFSIFWLLFSPLIAPSQVSVIASSSSYDTIRYVISVSPQVVLPHGASCSRSLSLPILSLGALPCQSSRLAFGESFSHSRNAFLLMIVLQAFSPTCRSALVRVEIIHSSRRRESFPARRHMALSDKVPSHLTAQST
jgi:hypothetical protein